MSFLKKIYAAGDPVFTKEYVDNLKKGEDARLRRERELKKEDATRQWAAPKLDFKNSSGCGGYMFFKEKSEAEKFIKNEIKDGKGSIEAILRLIGEADKPKKRLAQYQKTAKPVPRESIYK